VIATIDTAISRRRTEEQVSLVAKIKDTAGNLYGQGKAKYESSDAMQKAGKQAGQVAGQVTERVKDMATKTSSAVKEKRAKSADHK
jgi:hypothetical protein